MKRKWNIEKNNKEKVQFQTLCKAPGCEEEGKSFQQKIEKGFQQPAVR